MATSSVAIPATPGDEEATVSAAAVAQPAMLDRARGLAAAGIAAGAAAAAAAAAVASSSTASSIHGPTTRNTRSTRAGSGTTTAAPPGNGNEQPGGGGNNGAANDRGEDQHHHHQHRQHHLHHHPNASAPASAATAEGAAAFYGGAVAGPSAAGGAGDPALLDAAATSTPLATPTATPMSPTRSQRPSSHRVTQGGRVTKSSARQQAGHQQRPSSASAAAALAATAATLSSVSGSSGSSTSTSTAAVGPSSSSHNSNNTASSSTAEDPSGHNLRRRGGSSGSNGAGSRTSSSSSLSSSSLLASSSPISAVSSTANNGNPNPSTKPAGHTKSNSVKIQSPLPSASATPSNAMAMDDDALVISFWGPDPVPLPSRFSRIKRNLIRGHEAELEACWARLITALRAEVEHIEGLGAHLIPSIEFADVDDPAQTARFGRDLRRYGVGVVRKVVPKPDADAMVRQTVQYLDDAVARSASANKGRPQPLPQDPTCYDFFWTPAQVRARAHPSVLRAQRFMMGLWETTPDDRLATRLPITYVDRIRIHNSATSDPASRAGAGANDGANDGDSSKVSSPLQSLQPPTPLQHSGDPQSADDWINALQSSAGIIAQVDNGSLERWEPDGYQRAGTYNNVFHGRWEDYDPWECASRVSATMDLYNGYGACTIFRMFQGVVALSTIEPGMIRLLPSPKLATAYYLLRPFFNPKTPAPPPGVRSGPEWDAYLHPDNWKLERNPDTIIHGAVPGHAQRITENWHPHLHLRSSMITLPTLQPGDYILWHPDLPYHISSSSPGLKTPTPGGGPRDDVSMLVYIPAAPLTQTNALYLARQRKAFQRGHPGPDFDSSGRPALVEDPDLRPGEKEIAEMGGPSALQAMGLAPWEAAATRAGTPPPQSAKSAGSKDEDAEMTEAGGEIETKSLTSSASGSHAEAEVIRLSNIILFPDRSMLGYSV